MVTLADLQRALSAITVAAPVHALGEVGSTNDVALELADDGAPEWTLVSADHQTAGRGRHGRSWVDVPGRAVMLSVVLRPTLPPNRVGLLSLLAGAAMATAIRDETGLAVSCKWPNDLLRGAAKVGGILGEGRVRDDRLDVVVIGLGVNIDAPDGIVGGAGIGDVSAGSLLARFLSRFHAVYVAGDASLPEGVRAAWVPVADTIGREVEATTAVGDKVRGRAVGIDGFGGLVVSGDHGERTVAFGEIAHLG